MSSYVYTKLDETLDQIRLVTILPGVSSSRLVLDLRNTSFRLREPAPCFEALSYTWGSSLDAPERYNSLRVTKNLEVALRHLHHADRPRIMCNDALFANQ
jgi:hypothetical protein